MRNHDVGMLTLERYVAQPHRSRLCEMTNLAK